MKEFMIKVQDVQSGEYHYFECEADTNIEAIDTVFEMLPVDEFRVVQTYMSVTDVYDHYNVRGIH